MADIVDIRPYTIAVSIVESETRFKSCQANLQTAYLTMSDAVRSLDTTDDGKQFLAQFDSMYKYLSQTDQKSTAIFEEWFKEWLKDNDIDLEYIIDEINHERELGEELGEGVSPFA